MKAIDMDVKAPLWVALANVRVKVPKERIGHGRKALLEGVRKMGFGFAGGKACLLACGLGMG